MTPLTDGIRRTAPTLALLAACASTWAQAPEPAPVQLVGRALPDAAALPAGVYKDTVLHGQALTVRTFALIGPEVADATKRYAGNNLACASCHQEAASKPFAIPWTGVSATFPQYRGREDRVSTVQERINGCMERSMNGRALPLDSPEMTAFVTYISFLSRGIAIGAQLEGAGLLASPLPNRRANLQAGAQVYQARCAVCHGANGQGQRVGQAGDAQGYVFPPLWGPDSFNNGAGMNRLIMAKRFVKHNMPQGTKFDAPQLSDDEAYDAAAYMLSQPRPLMAGLERDFPARWNKPVDAAFAPYLLDADAEQHRFGPYPPLLDKQRALAAQRKAQADKK